MSPRRTDAIAPGPGGDHIPRAVWLSPAQRRVPPRRELKVKVPLATLACLKECSLSTGKTLSVLTTEALRDHFEAFPSTPPSAPHACEHMAQRIAAMGHDPEEPRELKVTLPTPQVLELHARKVLYGQTITAAVADALARHLEARHQADDPR